MADDGQWAIPDLFRLAQVYFDLWRGPMPCRIAAPAPALMHWTSPLPIRLAGVPNLVTIHDLIPLRIPALTATDSRRYRRLVNAVARTADALVAVSAASADEFAAAFPDQAAKLHTLPQAVRLPPAILEQPQAATATLIGKAAGLHIGGYFLFTGTIEPRKNLPRLIEAFLASASRRRLVLVGPDGWRAATELERFRDRIGGPDSAAPVLRLPHTDRVTQLALIQGARAMLFPSLAEGFGLPILEAMALGTPVLTSAGGATGEVAADAALLVDPLNGADIAQGISALDHNDALCARLRQAGLTRAAAFAPDRYADGLARLYGTVMEDFTRASRIAAAPPAYAVAAAPRRRGVDRAEG